MLTRNKKFRPTDGSEEEKKKEEEKKLAVLEQETFEQFIKKSEEERAEKEEQKKEELKELEKSRKSKRDLEEEERIAREKENARTIGGQKAEIKKTFVLDKGSGIFDSKGRRLGYGTQKIDKKIERTIKTGAKGVSIKKQREFMQLLGKYHNLKNTNLGTMDRDEILKFETGLRRGGSDIKFKEFTQEMKKEGIIRNSAGVKKFFSRRELKAMKNALLGQEDHMTYKRVDKTELINKRSGASSSKGPVKPGSN
ncbi:MAG: hypothetical protein PHI66_01000 [Candidatus Pacebacteria bacterium]|nr:hypothetical protein [Candidatus Paceibacterota bacterium]